MYQIRKRYVAYLHLSLAFGQSVMLHLLRGLQFSFQFFNAFYPLTHIKTTSAPLHSIPIENADHFYFFSPLLSCLHLSILLMVCYTKHYFSSFSFHSASFLSVWFFLLWHAIKCCLWAVLSTNTTKMLLVT